LQHVGTLELTWREVDLCIVQKAAVLVVLYFVYDCVTAALWLLYYTCGTAHVFPLTLLLSSWFRMLKRGYKWTLSLLMWWRMMNLPVTTISWYITPLQLWQYIDRRTWGHHLCWRQFWAESCCWWSSNWPCL